MLDQIKKTLIGVAPLLMHNGQTADKLNTHARLIAEITSKQKKTDDDHHKLRQQEWFGCLYVDPTSGRIAMPSDNVLSMVVHGCRKRRKGKQAAAGVLARESYFPLGYDGPENPIDLYEIEAFRDVRGVGVSGKRVMRCRPRFDAWSLEITLMVEQDVIETDDVLMALKTAGEIIGIGDGRPRYGRFRLES